MNWIYGTEKIPFLGSSVAFAFKKWATSLSVAWFFCAQEEYALLCF